MEREDTKWTGWAIAVEGGRGRYYTGFAASDRIAAIFGDGGKLVRVRVTADPEGTYWGWLEAGAPRCPIMIQPSEPAFRVQFPYGVEGAVKRGDGKVVRLTVEEVEVDHAGR